MAFLTKASLFGLKIAGFSVSANIVLPLLAQFPEYTFLVAISGLSGGAARWMADRHNMTFLDGISSMLAGILVATFMWPTGKVFVDSIVGKLELEPAASVMLGGFIMGIIGLSIVGGVLDVFRARKKRILNDDPTE